MQYRCYSWGFKLGDGSPPVEALDGWQRIIVGETDAVGLRADWMSGYSVCEFCLLFEEFFGTMDKAEPGPHYSFADYGRAIYREDKWSYYDSVLANRLLMAHNVLTGNVVSNLPLPLADMMYDQLAEVRATQIRLAEEQEKREAYEKTLRFKAKKTWRKVRYGFMLPYHLQEGFNLLWQAVTMSKDMTEDEQEDMFEFLCHNGQFWDYENDRNAPFAKFELWALGKLHNRFFHLNKKEN